MGQKNCFLAIAWDHDCVELYGPTTKKKAEKLAADVKQNLPVMALDVAKCNPFDPKMVDKRLEVIEEGGEDNKSRKGERHTFECPSCEAVAELVHPHDKPKFCPFCGAENNKSEPVTYRIHVSQHGYISEFSPREVFFTADENHAANLEFDLVVHALSELSKQFRSGLIRPEPDLIEIILPNDA